MVKAVKGVLVQCDPSIKAIILKADAEKNEYIVEDLDDQTLVVKENQLASLKSYLDQVVCWPTSDFSVATIGITDMSHSFKAPSKSPTTVAPTR